MRGLDQRLSSGAISGDQYLADRKAIDAKYGGIAPGSDSAAPKAASIPPDVRSKLDASVSAMHPDSDAIPESVIGRVITLDGGKKYKVVNNNGEVDYEPVK